MVVEIPKIEYLTKYYEPDNKNIYFDPFIFSSNCSSAVAIWEITADHFKTY